MSLTLSEAAGAADTGRPPALGLWSTADRGRTLLVHVPHKQNERIADLSVSENSRAVAVEVIRIGVPGRDNVRLVRSTRSVPLAAPLGNRKLTMTWDGVKVPLLQAVPAGGQDAEESAAERAKKELVSLIDTLEPGSALPSERVLSERLEIARMTLRHAVDELTLAGKVSRRRGSGTYVAESKLLCRITPDGLDLDPAAPGAGFGHVHVVRDVVAADEQVAGDLGIEPGDLVLHIGRLLLVDHRPFGLVSRHIPIARLAETPGAPSALRWFSERTSRVDTRIQLSTATPAEARLLDLSQVQPMLAWHRIAVDKKDIPLERTRVLARGDRVVIDLPS
ncbi:GntR family transcriptional regulator [Kibdelosporangium persicum]|uniref:DNA-binding transcriptional regulator, GntR family n=1 Tax=Kibdelosporangium persicum TaxID=2698649 RepID=A0ABX2EWP2_9PSEU|nr:GntR family transcriptional regulator [Kibdelosporangium persicum]NRN63284.1 DNA-binding transcriptional regulator, GntR family [Kibdelosporangium persicum]